MALTTLRSLDGSTGIAVKVTDANVAHAPAADVTEMTTEQKATAIIRAAAKARGEIVDEPEPISALAQAILDAGKKRRNEQ